MTKEFMQRFTADDPFRPITGVVFPTDGYYVATDAKHMIMVKDSDCHFELDYDKKKHGKTLNVLAVCDPEKISVTHRVKLSDLRAYIERISTEDEVVSVEVPTVFKQCDCDECDDGKITLHEYVRWGRRDFEIEEEVDCPVCHGFGKIPVDPEYDPDECDESDDVENWITDEEQKTGRKVIGEKTLCYIGKLCLRATYLPYVQQLMEFLGVDILDFAFEKRMVVFKAETLCYAICGVLEDRDDKTYTFVDELLPINCL